MAFISLRLCDNTIHTLMNFPVPEKGYSCAMNFHFTIQSKTCCIPNPHKIKIDYPADQLAIKWPKHCGLKGFRLSLFITIQELQTLYDLSNKRHSLNDVQTIPIPKVEDTRGNLAVVEKELLGYPVKRIYYLYDVPSSALRGGHSHKEQHETLVALSGSFEVVLNDGKNEKTIFLNKPDKGLHIVPGIWRELKNFSSGAVCLVFASDVFSEADYVRDFAKFIKSKA